MNICIRRKQRLTREYLYQIKEKTKNEDGRMIEGDEDETRKDLKSVENEDRKIEIDVEKLKTTHNLKVSLRRTKSQRF